MAAEELKGKIEKLNKIFKQIQLDLEEYSTSEENGNPLNINECDVKHLNLEPLEDGEWHVDVDSVEELFCETPPLARALKLRKHVSLASTYRKNMDLHHNIKEIQPFAVNWLPEYRIEFVNIIDTMLSLESETWAALKKLSQSMETARKSLMWGKHNLHRACGHLFEITDKLVKEGAEGKACERSGNVIKLLCDRCKEFGSKSELMIDTLAPYFRKLLNEYYENHKAAENQEDFIDAVAKCKQILKQFGLSIDIRILSFKLHPLSPKPHFINVTSYLNETVCFVDDPARFPDVNRVIVRLKLSIENENPTVSTKDKETVDLYAPVENSMTSCSLKYFPSTYKAILFRRLFDRNL